MWDGLFAFLRSFPVPPRPSRALASSRAKIRVAVAVGGMGGRVVGGPVGRVVRWSVGRVGRRSVGPGGVGQIRSLVVFGGFVIL